MNQDLKINSTGQIKFDFKTLVILLLFLIGVYFLIPRLIDAQQAAKLIFSVNKYYLILAVCCEFLSYIGAAWLLGILLSSLGYRIYFWDRFRIGSIAAFAIHFVPLGTFGQGAVDYYFLKKRKVETGSILLMLILRILIIYIAFFSLFLVALALVPTVKSLALGPKLISMIVFLIVFLGILYLVYLYFHKEVFRRVWRKILLPVNFFFSRSKKGMITEGKSNEVFEDIYKGLGLFSRKKRTLAMAICAGLIYWLGDICCFFFVFLSFGYFVHFSVLTFSYAIGALAGMVSFIPGGLGVTEGTLGLVLTGFGVPSATAIMSILVFRFFSFWIWIPVGLYSFVTLQKKIKSQK